MSKFDILMKRYEEISKIGSAISIVSFDQQTNMPVSGAEYRGSVIEALSLQIARALKSKAFLSAISMAKDEVYREFTVEEKKVLAAEKLIIIEDIERSVKFSNRIPLKIHGKLSKLSSKCNAEWEKVKTKTAKNDKAYLKVLEQYVSVLKESIKYANQGEFATNYDYLLDGYSRGFTSAQIESIFSKVKPFVVDILSKTKAEEELKFDMLEHEIFPIANHIAEDIIGDKTSFKLQSSTHPFCATLGKNDVRITTRYKKDNVLDTIGSVVHEAGHATYELGLPKNHYGNVLGSAASIACHEGISLFYEKHIGESEEMITRLSEATNFSYPEIRSWMRSIDGENPIRTESDEITYQLHIINRFTIEKELFNGDLKVKDIPARWNELYGKEFTPEMGYCQDVHWSHGSFGYFPSYTLGHLIAAQLRQKMEKEIKLFEDGEIGFEVIRNWLTENYFKHGGKYTSERLVLAATNEELNPEHWFNFIKKKHNL